jgi:sugar phosphate isomerase/epimerase
MNKLGIRAHDVGKYHANELAAKIDDLGFDGVQLVIKKALLDDAPFDHLDVIKNAFVKPYIMMLGAYFNPVHPDEKEVRDGIQYFKKHLEIASHLGTSYVGSETGSYQGSPWTLHPKNHTDEAMDRVVEVFRELADEAKKHNVFVAIEGAYQHIAYSPKRLKDIIDRIHSPHVKVIVDLFNYLHIGNIDERMTILDEAIDLFGDQIVIFHLKDFIIQDNRLVQVGLGQGLMDYPKIIKLIKEKTPDAYLIFEGVTGDDIVSSYQLIQSLLIKEV